MIEIEKIALLSDNEYANIGTKITSNNGTDLGENNTESVFFLSPDARIKVQRNSSKGTAKIAWKSGAAADGITGRREIELSFLPDDMEDALDLIKALVPGVEIFETKQLRHDYEMTNGTKIAVKHSDDYGFHAEFEQLIADDSGRDEALSKLDQAAQLLSVKLLSEDEESAFIKQALERRKSA